MESPFSAPALFGRRNVLAGAAALMAVPLAAPLARAQAAAAQPGQSAVIDVNRARSAPIPVAIPPLLGSDATTQDLGGQIAGVITADLANCGLFQPVSPGAFVASNGSEVPNFQSWGAAGAQALVTGRVENQGGQVRIEFRLWDVLPQQQIQGTAYTAAAGNWRRIAHIMADVIYERLLGEKGYFDTRIAYVSQTGPRQRRTRRLALMDQDGANSRYLTDGTWMVLTPRFHPSRELIAYMSYTNNRPRVYLYDLPSGQQRVLGDFRGMTFSPRFNPAGDNVIMAITNDAGGSDIISVDLNGHMLGRLTSSGAIDVSPGYSPDGRQIVFNSDRSGDQQLFVMDAGGGAARRISYGNGRYATPVWSPRGDLIAFTRLGTETFQIGVMHPDGSGERILSEGFDVEGPTFCPNGRVLMFWRTNAAGGRGAGYSSKLVSIDITGFNERVIGTPTDASDPSWSPLLG
jgi:TolB protein